MKDNLLIGVGGLRNSGKDTVTNIMDYIFRNGITRADYKRWIINGINNTIYKNQTIAFADGIKDILSRLFGIKRECFDDRVFKDEIYYHLGKRQFISSEAVEKEHVCIVRSQMINTNFGLNGFMDGNNCIKLRTLMQWFGTEIGRYQIYDEVWIDDTIRREDLVMNLKLLIKLKVLLLKSNVLILYKTIIQAKNLILNMIIQLIMMEVL